MQIDISPISPLSKSTDSQKKKKRIPLLITNNPNKTMVDDDDRETFEKKFRAAMMCGCDGCRY